MNPTDPQDDGTDGRPTPPPVPEKWTKPDPDFDRALRQQEKRQSPWGIFLKALGVMAIGVLVLFGLLLGTCFLLAVTHR